MKIWLVTIGETLGGENGTRLMRTGRLAERLARQGHQVTWWTGAFEHQRKQMLVQGDVRRALGPNLEAQFLRGCGYQRNVSIKRYVDHRIIARKFTRLASRETPPDVIVASLPCHQLAFAAASYARHARVPVIVDVRDLWPDIFVDKAPAAARSAVRLLFARDFQRGAAALSMADSIVAVSEGYLEWGLRKAGRDRRPGRDRVFYLGADAPRTDGQEVPGWLRPVLSSKIFAFVGSFGRSYQLELVLDAAARMEQAGRKDVAFVIVGTGDQHQRLAERARSMPNVVLPGWVGPGEIESLLAHAYAGLAPYSSVDHTVPNKPFEYMAAGVPVISSLEGEMADLVRAQGIGLNYLPGDLEGLCAAITRMLDDERGRDAQSVRSREFFARHGNADRIYDDYASHVVQVGRREASAA